MSREIIVVWFLFLFGLAVYGFLKTCAGVKPEHHKKFQYLGPLLFVLPGVLSRSDWIHLFITIASIIAFVVSFGMIEPSSNS